MNERSLHTRIRTLLKSAPPLIKRNLNNTSTKPLDRTNLRLGRSRGRDHCTGNPEPSRTRGDTLGHVTCGRCHHATLELFLRQVRDCVSSAANLERSNRLEIFQ